MIGQKPVPLRGTPSDLQDGRMGSFLCRTFFGSFGAARFFLANAGMFLVVTLLHDFFFLLVCLARFFLVTGYPPPWRSNGLPLSFTVYFSWISSSCPSLPGQEVLYTT